MGLATAPPAPPQWRPLLDGELAARAIETATAIAADLAAPRAGEPPLGWPDAERALLFTYLSQALPGRGCSLCRDPACAKAAWKTRQIGRALKGGAEDPPLERLLDWIRPASVA